MVASPEAVCSRLIHPFLLITKSDMTKGRRYFRFFRFIDCFSKAWNSFQESEGTDSILATGKWSCLGVYLGMESLAIVSLLIPNTTEEMPNSSSWILWESGTYRGRKDSWWKPIDSGSTHWSSRSYGHVCNSGVGRLKVKKRQKRGVREVRQRWKETR